MLIQCPGCGQRAKLPESKEGAKVRCSECSRVYVARPPGAKRPASTDPTKYIVMGTVAVVLLGLVFWIKSLPDREFVVEAQEEEAPPPPPKAITGWDSPLVQKALEIHDAVHAQDAAALADLIDPRRSYMVRNADPEAEDTETVEPGPMAAGVADWLTLSELEQQRFKDEVVQVLIDGTDYALVGPWRPWDGWIVSEEGRYASVRVRVANRQDDQAADRHVEWHLVRDGRAWKAFSWERWISPEEETSNRAPRTKKYTKRTLSDGSLVIESDVRVLGHLEDTPEELREEIDRLILDLVNIDSRPGLRTAARNRLYEIGRPAVPPLLSQIALIPLDSLDQAIQLQQVHMLLYDMTGYETSFKPHEALGATKERQESGLKQWFGWYDRKFKRYEGPGEIIEGEDPLEKDFVPRNEREAREVERARKDLERERERSGGL